MAIFADQLRQVLRRLGRAPLFTAITLITLAVGVGANTVIFSVVEGVLLKPLPYPHAEQLIGVWHTAPGIDLKELNMSPSIYFIDREQSTTFQDIGMYDGDSLSVTGVGEPEQVRGLDVTDGTLPILGVKPALGRLFTREDDSAAAPDTVLLSYGYWQHKFGGATSVIGRSLTVDGKPREIIGVVQQGFHFLDDEDSALFLPFKCDRDKIKLGNFSYEGIARLKPGVTMEQASADVVRMLPVVIRSFPAPEGFSVKLFEQAHIAPNLRPLKQDVVGTVGNVLWVLMGSIVMVLLIACANVANLLLVRVDGTAAGTRDSFSARRRVEAHRCGIAIRKRGAGDIGKCAGIGTRLRRVARPGGDGADWLAARFMKSASILPVLLFTFGIALFTSLSHRANPGVQVCGRACEQRLARGRAALSQSRRAASRTQGAGGGAGSAGAGSADLFGA